MKTNNERLRDLVEASGLSQPAALEVFNHGFGDRPYTIDAFKGFLARPDSTKFRPLKDELLAHAEKNFDSIDETWRNAEAAKKQAWLMGARRGRKRATT